MCMAVHWHRQRIVSIKMKLLFKFKLQQAEIKLKKLLTSHFFKIGYGTGKKHVRAVPVTSRALQVMERLPRRR